MGTKLTWERTEAAGELLVAVNGAGGPITGATVVVRVRDGETPNSYLDFADGVFKAAGHTTIDGAMAEVTASGTSGYYRRALDLTAITLPASNHLIAEYRVTSPTGFPQDADVIELVTSYLNVPADTQPLVLSDATPFAGANVDAAISTRATQAQILSDATPFAGANVDAAISSRAVAGDAMALTPGGVDGVWDEALAGHLGAGSTGEALAAGASGGAPADVADAVWDEARAGHVAGGSFGESLQSTVASRATQADILSDATPFAGADVDAAVSSRSSHSAADVDTVLTAAHGAGGWGTAAGFAVPGDAMALTPAAEAAVATAVGALSVDAGGGGQDLLSAMRSILSMSLGRFVRTDISATVTRFQFFERDGATPLYQMEITDGTGNGRERLSG